MCAFIIRIIAAVSERIKLCACACAAVIVGGSAIAPCIVCVASEDGAGRVIESYNIALQILFKVIGIENILRGAGAAVMYRHRRAGIVINVDKISASEYSADNKLLLRELNISSVTVFLTADITNTNDFYNVSKKFMLRKTI